MTGEWENQFAGWEESSERVGISDYRKTGKNSLKNSERAGDMAQRWQALATFRGTLQVCFPSPIWHIKTVCNCDSRGSNVLFCLLGNQAHKWLNIHTHEKAKFKKEASPRDGSVCNGNCCQAFWHENFTWWK